MRQVSRNEGSNFTQLLILITLVYRYNTRDIFRARRLRRKRADESTRHNPVADFTSNPNGAEKSWEETCKRPSHTERDNFIAPKDLFVHVYTLPSVNPWLGIDPWAGKHPNKLSKHISLGSTLRHEQHLVAYVLNNHP